MINNTYRLPKGHSTVLVSTLLIVLISGTAVLARQSQPALQITTPTSGTTVSPGQTLSVTVGSPAGLTFAQVDVIAESPIGLTTSTTSLPAQFSVSIPSNIACGPRMLTAELHGRSRWQVAIRLPGKRVNVGREFHLTLAAVG